MRILFFKGLPGSGKTSWAKGCLASPPRNSVKRVNKDDLRAMLDNSLYSPESETLILKIQEEIIRICLKEGKDVIVDDTNLDPKHETRIRAIAEEFNVGFEIVDFTNVDIEVCISNDLKRLNSVGERVIRGMYEKYLN